MIGSIWGIIIGIGLLGFSIYYGFIDNLGFVFEKVAFTVTGILSIWVIIASIIGLLNI